jgi:hypothetical protein
MRVHKTEECFKEQVNETAQCPSCTETFVIGNGVVYEGEYTRNGQWKYGYVCFCSTECLLSITQVEGNC